MNKSKIITLLLLSIPLFISLTLSSESQDTSNKKAKTLTRDIAQENISAIPLSAEDGGEDTAFDYYSYLESEFKQQLNPPPRAKRERAFTLFETYNEFVKDESSKVLDKTTACDLNLFRGSAFYPQIYLGGQVNRTQLDLGAVALLHMIAQPLVSSEDLQKRQMVIKELIKQSDMLQPIFKEMEAIKGLENLVLTLFRRDIFDYSRRSEFTGESLSAESLFGLPSNSLVIKDAAMLEPLAWLRSLASFFRYSSNFLELQNGVNQINRAMHSGLMATSSLAVGLKGASLCFNWPGLLPQKMQNLALRAQPIANFTSIYGLLIWLIQLARNSQSLEALNHGLGFYQHGTMTYYELNDYRGALLRSTYTQTKLIAFARYIKLMQTCRELIAQNPILKEHLPVFKKLDDIFGTFAQKSTDFNYLLELLETETFKGEASFFSRFGRIIAAQKLIKQFQSELSQAFVALGELDAYFSIVRLYQEQQGKGAQWTFPTYEAESETPFIDAQAFWNPMIHPDKVVVNSLQWGTGGNPRAVLITGANAGGKSTAMTALVYGALLGQTIGIVPAHSFAFTPFTKIMTYLKITDDVAAANSHFKAGVVRAQALASTVENLKDKEFSITAVDEVFNGTTCAEGEAAAYSFIELLGSFPHNLCMTTTHFPLITELEKTAPDTFKNYKVGVTFDQGKLVYPFKLEQGISDQVIAFDVLKEEGFSAEFLTKAHLVLDRIKSSREAAAIN